MKNWKRLVALLLSLALVLSLCACNSGGADESGSVTDGVASGDPSDAVEPSLDPDATPSIEVDLSQHLLAFAAGVNPEDELLTIDGVGVPADLTLYWLYMNCSQFLSYYGMFGLSLADYADMLLDDTVSLCIYYTMLRQKATELGCLPTDAQIQDAHDRMMADGEENYEMLKAAYGLSDESMEYIFTMQAYYQNLLDAMVPTATEEMLNNYAYQARHILLLTVDMDGEPVQQEDGSYAYPPLDDETIAEKRAQAEDLLAQLRASSDPETLFNELMNQYSEDSGLESNPDGYTTTVGEMVPEFEQGALALEPGGISDIIESSYGYHIILRGEVADLDSYAEDCREYELDGLLTPELDAMTATRSAALDALDVVSFYERYAAYQNAVVAQYQPETEPSAEPSAETGDEG